MVYDFLWFTMFLWFTIFYGLRFFMVYDFLWFTSFYGLRFLATKFSKVSWWALWIGDPINFHNSFFVNNYYLNLIFFQALQRAFFKNETKNFQKDASQLKIAWQLTLAKERRGKYKKKPNNSFFTFIFLYRKTYILLENILEET